MWGPSNAAQFLAVAPNPAPEGRRSAPPEASMANPQSIRFHTNNAEREQPNLRVPLPGHGSGTSDSPNISPGRRGGAGGETLSPRQPFLMPNMDPLVRQQGLLFQQSELLREQFMKFAEAFQRLHSSVEELRDDLQAEHQQRLHSEENLASMVASLRAEVHDQIDEKMALLREEVSMRSRSSDAEVQRLGSGLDTVSQHLSEQIMGMSEGQLKMADNLAAKIAAVQDSFGSSMASKVSLEDLRQKMEKQLHQVKESADASLRSREAALREEIASIRSEATVEAEQWSQRVAAVEKASQKLCTEMANEHQQTRISAVGLATELNELRDALSKESQSYQESTSSVQRWVTETMALKQALQDEEIAQAALTHSVAENKQELDTQVALSKTLAEATAEYKSGKEELWQAMSSVEESNKQTVKDERICEEHSLEAPDEKEDALTDVNFLLRSSIYRGVAGVAKDERTCEEHSLEARDEKEDALTDVNLLLRRSVYTLAAKDERTCEEHSLEAPDEKEDALTDVNLLLRRSVYTIAAKDERTCEEHSLEAPDEKEQRCWNDSWWKPQACVGDNECWWKAMAAFDVRSSTRYGRESGNTTGETIQRGAWVKVTHRIRGHSGGSDFFKLENGGFIFTESRNRQMLFQVYDASGTRGWEMDEPKRRQPWSSWQKHAASGGDDRKPGANLDPYNPKYACDWDRHFAQEKYSWRAWAPAYSGW